MLKMMLWANHYTEMWLQVTICEKEIRCANYWHESWKTVIFTKRYYSKKSWPVKYYSNQKMMPCQHCKGAVPCLNTKRDYLKDVSLWKTFVKQNISAPTHYSLNITEVQTHGCWKRADISKPAHLELFPHA